MPTPHSDRPQPPWLCHYRPMAEYPDSLIHQYAHHQRPKRRRILKILIGLDDPAGFTALDLSGEAAIPLRHASAWLSMLAGAGIIIQIDTQEITSIHGHHIAYRNVYRFHSRFYGPPPGQEKSGPLRAASYRGQTAAR